MNSAFLDVQRDDFSLKKITGGVGDPRDHWNAETLSNHCGMRAFRGCFGDDRSGISDGIEIVGICVSGHKNLTRLKLGAVTRIGCNSHLATDRPCAEAGASAENSADNANLDQVGGAADSCQGSGGLHTQVTILENTHLLSDSHGKGEGCRCALLGLDQQGCYTPDQLELSGH